MTCIAAFCGKNYVCMGGDSASYGGGINQITLSPKVFTRGKFIIGYTTSFRMGQILEAYFDLKELNTKFSSVPREVLTEVIPHIREIFKLHGYMKVDNNRESAGNFLLGYEEHLFNIDSDLQATPIKDYSAVGCGEQFALGSMYKSKIIGEEPDLAVSIALKAAAHHSYAVKPPFTILKNSS